MNVEVEKSKQAFTAAYQTAEKSNSDKLELQNLQTFKATITSTDNYFDSLKTEMDKLNEMDVHNVEPLKSIFLYKGAGDTINNKLNRTIVTAQVVARTENQKAAIEAVSDSLGIEPTPPLSGVFVSFQKAAINSQELAVVFNYSPSNYSPLFSVTRRLLRGLVQCLVPRS